MGSHRVGHDRSDLAAAAALSAIRVVSSAHLRLLIFHAKMGLIKDRHGLDLTEAEDIKKRWQEYTEELY